MQYSLESIMERVRNKNADQPEFHQAVQEVLESIWSFLEDNPHYLHELILYHLSKAL